MLRQITAEDFDWNAEVGPAAELRRIASAATAVDGTYTLNEQALLTLRNHGLSAAQLWLAEGGFAFLDGPNLDLVVDPRRRREGIGRALAEQVAERLRGDANASTRGIEAWSHCDHPAATRLASHFGIERTRELRVMRREMTAPLAPMEVPEGITIRHYQPGDETALLEVNSAAFAHHPEQGEMTTQDFAERRAESWWSPQGLILAVPTDPREQPGLLGFHWTKIHHDEEPAQGEVYVVAVNPKAAGRGLGTVLTLAGLHHLKAQGLAEVILYVDGDNDPAVALYEKLGFTPLRSEAQYCGHIAESP